MDDLLNMVNSDAYTAIAEQAAASRVANLDDKEVFAHLDSLATVMPRFKAIMNRRKADAAANPPAAPQPTDN